MTDLHLMLAVVGLVVALGWAVWVFGGRKA